jgi:hypothetical protein
MQMVGKPVSTRIPGIAQTQGGTVAPEKNHNTHAIYTQMQPVKGRTAILLGKAPTTIRRGEGFIATLNLIGVPRQNVC